MNFLGTNYYNPLEFLDKLSEVRHRIIHASSIIDESFIDKNPVASKEKGNLFVVESKMAHHLFAFYFLLTDYIDNLFSQRFG